MKKSTLLILILIMVAGMTASAQIVWMSFHETKRQMLMTIEGPDPRYQVHYFKDHNSPSLCVLIIINTQTGQFTAVNVPTDACRN